MVERIPSSMAAFTRQASNNAMSSRPKMASSVCGSRRLPSVTVVAGSGTMMPAFRNPINAMNRPTPAATAE